MWQIPTMTTEGKNDMTRSLKRMNEAAQHGSATLKTANNHHNNKEWLFNILTIIHKRKQITIQSFSLSAFGFQAGMIAIKYLYKISSTEKYAWHPTF